MSARPVPHDVSRHLLTLAAMIDESVFDSSPLGYRTVADVDELERWGLLARGELTDAAYFALQASTQGAYGDLDADQIGAISRALRMWRGP